MNLCLGTVQFGLDYGIKGQKKPDMEDAVAWLDYATQNGITAIDTAKAYGTAEQVVGEFLRRRTIPREKLFISTKMLPNLLDEYEPKDYERIVESELKAQLQTLGTDHVDAYIYHSARYAFDEYKIEAISAMKKKGLALKTGVSVYEPDEAFACLKNPNVEFMQMPYSIFDHRMKKSGVFDSPGTENCEIHTRSAFIQGLITMDESDVPPFLEKAKPIVQKIRKLSEEEGISRVALALQYVKREKGVSHLVFGVDSLDQLKEDIRVFREDIDPQLVEEIGRAFDGLDADIVMPSLWKK